MSVCCGALGRFWHEADVPARSNYVGSWGKSGLAWAFGFAGLGRE
jgi:hypothetical protein